ncbi:MAG: CRTAC1 family protein, partial [Bacteroidia bacterium]|nr:CRTAC1 family protein [Bacteroidia bacterium]
MSFRTYIYIICIGVYSFSPSLSTAQTYLNVAPQNNIVEAYGPAMIAGGVSFCDINNDGWDDLTYSSCIGDSVHFYINNGGVFQKIPSLVSNTKEVTQILWADYDNDGDKDLFLAANYSSNKLYQNSGGLALVDVTVSAGISTTPTSTFTANWLDFNKDGHLDLFVTNYLVGPNDINELYKNNGNGTFTNIAISAGVTDSLKEPLASACLDFNNDTWPDIYTAQDKYTVNSLYQNNQNNTFTNVGIASGANLAINAMSAAVGDYDNNGCLDIYVTNTQQGNKFLHNNGNSTFSELALFNGTTFNGIGWGAQFLDYDLDMLPDLYVSGSLIPSQGGISSAFYKNLGNGSFSQISGTGFLGDTVRSYGNAIGDVNNDGFPDIAVCNLVQPHHVWQNNFGSGNWLKIKLEGVISNRDGIGSWIKIYAQGVQQVRYTMCGQGFLSQNSFTEFFGLSSAPQADSIIITWPSGAVDKFFNVHANQLLSVTETETNCDQNNPIALTVSVKNNSCNSVLDSKIQCSASG